MSSTDFTKFAEGKITELDKHMKTLDLSVPGEATEWLEYAGVVNKLKLALEEVVTPIEQLAKGL